MTDDERQRIEAACQRLAIAFAVNLDHRRYDAVAALFTADALYNPRGIPFYGREGVLAYLRERPPERRSRHLVTNHLVEVADARSASGLSYLSYFVHEGPLAGDEPAPLSGPASSATIWTVMYSRRRVGAWLAASAPSSSWPRGSAEA